MLPRHYFYLQAVAPKSCSTRRMNKAPMHKLNTGMHMRVELASCSLLAQVKELSCRRLHDDTRSMNQLMKW